MDNYKTTFEVKWAEVDPNMHLRHTAYLDFADQARIRFFRANGFSFNKLMQMGIGPIIFGTETDYRKEILLSETITIDCELLEQSSDGRKWKIKHDVYKEDGSHAATLTYRGAWMDIRARKLTAPPEEIVKLLDSLSPKMASYEE
ncbi:acyl-CoA thioesterase [Fulvivirga sp. RKSG066]|uniref:acyl-CoA thioesterase n=1 Tax=Fulvivirga aurantia TaxID=2529383 RepID=UPI0012BC4BBB|nr:acyl-CoA thioesterase [Fulvivirga aurantia]MTI22200.1 acyl-CoA thioesterase [Fulvivirga aurantia]